MSRIEKTNYWETQIAKQAESGQSAVSYCAANNLSIVNFYKWRSYLNKKARGSGFAELQVTKSLPIQKSEAVRVRITEFELSSAELGILLSGRHGC